MSIQVLMVNKSSGAKVFEMLEPEDKDLIMFTITDLRLEKSSQQVHMVLSLKRKVQTEMVTTYLPNLLLLAITYATTFFKPAFLEASLTENLTIMLVMITIFTSEVEELPHLRRLDAGHLAHLLPSRPLCFHSGSNRNRVLQRGRYRLGIHFVSDRPYGCNRDWRSQKQLTTECMQTKMEIKSNTIQNTMVITCTQKAQIMSNSIQKIMVITCM